MYKGVTIIAEVKTKSPFGYISSNSWDELFEVASDIGDIISIHTDERWGGSFKLLEKARKLTKKPILAKGIHSNDGLVQEAINAGADWVFVVGRIPKVFPEKCIIESENLEQLSLMPKNFRVVWNTRDLSNGKNKKEKFVQARALRKGWLCQASNIKTVSDIEDGANAVLVGTHLIEFAQSLSAGVKSN